MNSTKLSRSYSSPPHPNMRPPQWQRQLAPQSGESTPRPCQDTPTQCPGSPKQRSDQVDDWLDTNYSSLYSRLMAMSPENNYLRQLPFEQLTLTEDYTEPFSMLAASAPSWPAEASEQHYSTMPLIAQAPSSALLSRRGYSTLPSSPRSNIDQSNHRARIDKLGPGWPRNYIPPFHRPWHHQHPSLVRTTNLLETCDSYRSVFPGNDKIFEPANMPWWSLWLVAFATPKTLLTEDDICLLYRYKYKDSIPDIERMEPGHIIELWHFLCHGGHEYAFEWDRSKEYEDGLYMLLKVWLSDAKATKRDSGEMGDRQCCLDFFNFDAT